MPLSALMNKNWGITGNNSNSNLKCPDFEEYVGVLDVMKNEGDHMLPADVFILLFCDQLLDEITFQTNLYATQKGKPFKCITKDELKVFLGINILMGIKRHRSYRDCWSPSELLRDHYISSLMSLNRFSWILSHIHVNDNALMPQKGEPGYDKLYKIWPVIDSLKSTFKKYYAPTQNQAVDECTLYISVTNSHSGLK
jgi:hypothetical protein